MTCHLFFYHSLPYKCMWLDLIERDFLFKWSRFFSYNCIENILDWNIWKHNGDFNGKKLDQEFETLTIHLLSLLGFFTRNFRDLTFGTLDHQKPLSLKTETFLKQSFNLTLSVNFLRSSDKPVSSILPSLFVHFVWLLQTLS